MSFESGGVAMPRRTDIKTEDVVREYNNCPNVTIAAEKLGCSIGPVKKRLKEAGVKIVQNNQHTYRKLNENKIESTERKIFDTKEEQAHYICTELGDALAELLCEIGGRT